MRKCCGTPQKRTAAMRQCNTAVMTSDYDWNDLKYFLAAWRTGTLAGASRLLHVDQTTAGRRLLALEEALGDRLLERTPDGFVLTAAGDRLIETAEHVEQGAIDLGRRAAGLDARLEGVVRVAATETMAVMFLARSLGRLHRAHPGGAVERVSGVAASS